MKRLEVECLKNTGKEKEKKENSMIMFAEAYVQVSIDVLRYASCQG